MVAIKDSKAEADAATGQDSTTTEPKSDSQQDGADRVSKPLDIIFLQDTTGSQGQYIDAARKAIRGICDKISTSADISKELIRFGLIAFRDHPPQDMTYVTRNFGFTSDIKQMERNLASLIASGGGDGPEAQTAAIADALNTEWTEDAMKIVILITDAPPHGLGEPGDGFDKSPDQNDPLELARQMAERGITLFLIACEPTLSQSYTHALDFYTALTDITSGRVFPLLMADKLGDYIVGTVVETIETERLIEEFEKVIVDDVYNKAKPMEAVTQNLQQFIADRGIKMTSMKVEDIYTHSAEAERNRATWGSAPSLAAGRAGVKAVTEPRIQAAYASETPRWVGSGSFGSRSRVAGGPPPPRSAMPLAPPPPTGYAMPAPGISLAAASAQPAEGDGFYVKAAISERQASTNFRFLDKELGLIHSISQAARIVQQSVSRSSKVTSEGYVSKTSGLKVPNQFEQKH